VGSLQRSPDPLAAFNGPTSNGKEEKGSEGKERGKGGGRKGVKGGEVKGKGVDIACPNL